MGYMEHKHHVPASINCAVLIISGSRTEQTDESGKYIMTSLKESGNNVTVYSIIGNDAKVILESIAKILGDGKTQAIITGGGTGASHMDITIETMAQYSRKNGWLRGLFRSLTSGNWYGSILSRAMAGIVKGKVIISLPGSLEAVKMAMQKIIIPELAHLVREASR